MKTQRLLLVVALLSVAGLTLSACGNNGTRTSARVYAGIGYTPYRHYYRRDVYVVPPDDYDPDIDLPIEPPPIAVPLPEPDFGGGFGGGYGGDFGGDFGGADLF